MCGFSGLIIAHHAHSAAANWKSRFQAAAQRIAHRGSDDNRQIQFHSTYLNHFRLAFQDLESGRQPMLSANGQYAITFNGEIYNHFELREKLNKRVGDIHWKTLSDTETILLGWLHEGESFFQSLEGEFAFVIVKTDGSEWIACRDFYGVKPLFFQLAETNTRPFSIAQKKYAIKAPVVSFSSEMKGLAGEKVWNRDGALRQFVGLYEPICTPFENIIQCPPGGLIKGRKCSDGSGPSFEIEVSTRTTGVRAGRVGGFWSEDSLQDNLEQFRDCLSRSVAERLLSDVELGVYLSGGIDSKAIAYELARNLKKQETNWDASRIKSFTVGFETTGYDESDEAIAFSKYLGFTPYVLPISENALNYSYPHAVHISENIQPYTNGAAKWWLSLFARRSVPGVLTGDGADEVLCGYPSFRYCNWWKFAQRSRPQTRPLGAHWRDHIYIKKFISQTQDPWLAGSSAAGGGDDFLLSLSCWGVPHPLFSQILTITEAILGQSEAKHWLNQQAESIRSWFLHGFSDKDLAPHKSVTLPERTLLVWQNYFCNTHLPVQVLNWVGDRMEMANTLEGRTPFLSSKLRAYIHGLPDVALVQGFTDKAVLRKAYASEFERQFALTPKKQFNAPFINFSRLFKEFEAAEVLEKMNILNGANSAAAGLMQLSERPVDSLSGVDERYRHTHHLSALQTIVCSAIVHRSLVEEQTPERNSAFEESIIAKGGPRA